MSKRFGRNQRRRAREALEWEKSRASYLQNELYASAQRLERLRQERSDLIATIQLTEKVLGEFFVTLPVKDFPACNVYEERLAIPSPGAPMPDGPRRTQASLMDKLTIIRAALMRGKTEFDALRCQMHIRFVAPDGQVAYAVSPKSFRGVPPEYAIRTITEEMANFLVNDTEFRIYIGLDKGRS